MCIMESKMQDLMEGSNIEMEEYYKWLDESSIEVLQAELNKDRRRRDEIQEAIERKEKVKYDKYLGKYWQVAATSVFRADSVNYVTGRGVCFTGLDILGGVDCNNGFEIRHDEDISLHNEEVETMREITREEFEKYIDDSFEYNKNKGLNGIKAS